MIRPAMIRRTSIRLLFLVAAAWLLPSGRVTAAPRIETFTAALNGWTNTAGTTAWRWTNQAAGITFAASPLPASSSLVFTGFPGITEFTGDFRAHGHEAIGFAFLAEQVLPTSLRLTLSRGTNAFFVFLHPGVTATGVWTRFLVPLEDKATGGWDGDEAALFESVLSAIDTVSITVVKPATVAAARFRIDDLVVDRLHTLATPEPSTSLIHLPADNLQTGRTYRIEQGPDPFAWTTAATFLATNRTQRITVTNTAGQTLYRIGLP